MIMDKETREMFNAVIAAIDRSQERLSKRFDALEKRMDRIATKKDFQNIYELLYHEIREISLTSDSETARKNIQEA